MKKVMKIRMVLVGMCLVLGMAVTGLGSTTNSGFKLRMEIPFSFHLGEVEMPAGEYLIEKMNIQGLMIFRHLDSGKAAKILTQAGVKRGEEALNLKFNRYGDRHFMNEIFDGQNWIAYHFTASKFEREIARAESKKASKPDLISLRAR